MPKLVNASATAQAMEASAGTAARASAILMPMANAERLTS
jgi:hypothetical protein